MHTFLYYKLYENIDKTIKDSESILIAVSGGQDSLCLINLFKDLLMKKDLRIEAIYIDHQWKKNSRQQIKHIINLIQKINIKLSICQIQSPTFSEMQARSLRYQLLVKHALQYKYKYIVTGHTENDKIETFLINLFKGTTLDGATSLNMIKFLNYNLYIIRPLLNLTRAEVLWFCRKLHLPIWSDITNYNYDIPRNRLRNELIPYLQQYFNSNIQKSLSAFLSITTAENEYLKENSIKLYIKIKHKQFVAFNLLILKKQHIALQIRTIKLFFKHHFNKSIDSRILRRILDLNLAYNNTLYTNQLVIQYKDMWIYANYTTKTKSQS